MTKANIPQYSATAASNTDVQDIDIAENCAPSGINNAIREIMADLKDQDTGAVAMTSPVLTTADINGGTADNVVIGGSVAVAGTFTTVTANTNVGIGEASPDTPLHITGASPEITVEDSTGDVYKFGNNNGQFRVYNVTDAREDLMINGSGDITVSGGVYLGGTGAANLLDDYEEGTYTVEMYDASSGGNASSTTTTGYYTKVGNQVTVRFDALNNISTTGMTGANDAYFTLPFAAGSTGRAVGSVIMDNLAFTTNRNVVAPVVSDGASRAVLITTGGGVTDVNVDVEDINDGATDIHTYTLTYFTA